MTLLTIFNFGEQLQLRRVVLGMRTVSEFVNRFRGCRNILVLITNSWEWKLILRLEPFLKKKLCFFLNFEFLEKQVPIFDNYKKKLKKLFLEHSNTRFIRFASLWVIFMTHDMVQKILVTHSVFKLSLPLQWKIIINSIIVLARLVR